MNPSVAKVRRWLLAGFVTVASISCGIAWWWAQAEGFDPREAVDWLLAQVRSVGPVAFFSLLAVLPAAGVPVSLFTLTAGSVFAPTLGMPLVILLALACLSINLVISYVLARWIMRPWVERLCGWLGFRMPAVATADHKGLVLLVRVTPGPPYALQNYLLGMAQIPFWTYLGISWAVVSVYSCAVILFGDSLVQGRGRGIVLAVSLLVALSVGVRFLRRYLKRKGTEAVLPSGRFK